MTTLFLMARDFFFLFHLVIPSYHVCACMENPGIDDYTAWLKSKVWLAGHCQQLPFGNLHWFIHMFPVVQVKPKLHCMSIKMIPSLLFLIFSLWP